MKQQLLHLVLLFQLKKSASTLFLITLFFMLPTLLSAQTQIGADIDGDTADDFFGTSVSFSSDGTRIAVGAVGNDGTALNAGLVRIYSESGGVWTQVGGDIGGEAAGDFFGRSISLSANGTRIAIGSVNNDGNGNNSGHVRVYSESGGVWTQVGGDIDGEASSDFSGGAISLSANGTKVAIGAYFNDGNGTVSGHVRVYSESGGVWTQIGSDIDGEAAGDEAGRSVSISADGTKVAIGATKNDGNGNNSGHVRVYSESGGVWTQVGGDIDGEAVNDGSGNAVSLSADGTIVAIGAASNDGTGTGTGHIRVYSESGGVWTQVGGDIDGEASSDLSGSAISLSADGTIVAIGATGNDGNGFNAGHVRVYSEIGGVWTQVGSDIDGEAIQDGFGGSVSLSADGTKIVIGATGNDGTASNAGHVRVYDLSSVLPVSLTYFQGEAITSGNYLNWETASEENNEGFEVQRSRNSENWETLDFVKGNGTTLDIQNYTYTDKKPMQGINYYRLKQIDFDGQFEYSDIVSITVASLKSSTTRIFPNPVRDALTIMGGQGQATIYNTLGQPVRELIISNEQLIINTSDLPKGQYILQIVKEDGSMINRSFLKQ